MDVHAEFYDIERAITLFCDVSHLSGDSFRKLEGEA